jgi:hypothetical protein
MHAASANDNSLPTQLGITEQFDGGEEGIHIEVGNTTNTVHKYSISNQPEWTPSADDELSLLFRRRDGPDRDPKSMKPMRFRHGLLESLTQVLMAWVCGNLPLGCYSVFS